MSEADVVPEEDESHRTVGASPDFDLRERLLKLGIPQVDFAAMLRRDPSAIRRWLPRVREKRAATPGTRPPCPMEVELLVDCLDVILLDRKPKPWMKALRKKIDER